MNPDHAEALDVELEAGLITKEDYDDQMRALRASANENAVESVDEGYASDTTVELEGTTNPMIACVLLLYTLNVGVLEPLTSNDDAIEEFTYCFIPVDDSEPYKELKARVPASGCGDQLKGVLRPIFADGACVKDEILRREFGGAGGEMLLGFQGDASSGACEAFPLVHASVSNSFCGISLYLDELGVLKNAKKNSRATGKHGSAYIIACVQSMRRLGYRSFEHHTDDLHHEMTWTALVKSMK